MKKLFIILFVVFLVSAGVVLLAQSSDVPDKVFNAEELAKFNGINGADAYVAVDGIVYDVSLVKAWKGGKHKMGIRAGKDLSKEIGKSPHGKKVLSLLPKRGYYKP
ncbi:MAG: cytochrome B5 [Spirochaetes bacterium]|nr:cytochrome B5 [Spirochaetota bacterium]